jgi:hypothetical protein
MVSFDIFALSPVGFEIHVKLEGDKIYADAMRLLERMAADGFLPRVGKLPAPVSSNGKDNHYCNEHGTDFKRFEKDGKTWYAHRTSEGKWHNQEKS